jgi:hypothetical protein
MRIYTAIFCFLLSIGLFAQELTEKQIKDLTKKPENLKAEIVTKDNKQFIHLTWGDEPHEDIAELEYLIYVSAFSEELAQQASIDIRKNSYYHPAPNVFGKNYKFQVEALYEKEYSYERSPISDTLEIYVPSRKLPQLYNLNGSREHNDITLSWKYSDRIDDLAGFRLYDDGVMIVSEKEIPATARNYTVKLKIPGKYKFQLQAISKYGIKTELSQSRTYTMSEE